MSTNNIRTIAPGKGITVANETGSTIVNAWAQVIAIARPTFDAVAKVQAGIDWLAYMQRYPIIGIDLTSAWKIDEADVAKRLALLPELPVLQEAAQLFDEAFRKSAPEAWFYLAIAAMLSGKSNAKSVPPGYSIEIVDMLLYDDQNRMRGCEPGVSPAVFISALRQVRLETDFAPGTASIMKACIAHRKRFRDLALETEILIDLRQNAEEAKRTLDWEDDGDLSQNQDLRDRWQADDWMVPNDDDMEIPF
jgi:hypothetical protein